MHARTCFRSTCLSLNRTVSEAGPHDPRLLSCLAPAGHDLHVGRPLVHGLFVLSSLLRSHEVVRDLASPAMLTTYKALEPSAGSTPGYTFSLPTQKGGVSGNRPFLRTHPPSAPPPHKLRPHISHHTHTPIVHLDPRRRAARGTQRPPKGARGSTPS